MRRPEAQGNEGREREGIAITHKRLFRSEWVPNDVDDDDVLRKLSDLQRDFASSEHVTVHLSPHSRVKVLWERRGGGGGDVLDLVIPAAL